MKAVFTAFFIFFFMKQILTNTEINAYCIHLLDACHEYSSYLPDYFYTFYYTGCRPSEPSQLERWCKVSNSIYSLLPLKNNNLRLITSEKIGANYKLKIDGASTDLPLLNAAYFNRYVEKIRLFPVYCGTKEVTTFIFRYNYIKSLYADGYTPAEIQVLTGHTNLSVVLRYINAEIYKNV